MLYSPERKIVEADSIQDDRLRELINSESKYFLMIGANRDYKNSMKAINAFRRYRTKGDKVIFAISGARGQSNEDLVYLPYLTEGDLSAAIKNCYALIYPSLFEGFGYPPLEAMKFGKPVLSSNTTSMPEVLGDAPIYFSPFYETDIYKAMMKLKDEYEFRVKKSIDRYALVHARQEADLDKLLLLILKGDLK